MTMVWENVSGNLPCFPNKKKDEYKIEKSKYLTFRYVKIFLANWQIENDETDIK